MAQSVQTAAARLVVPGAYTDAQVKATASNIGVTGVLIVLGESTGGPDFSEEETLANNSFGPDQIADVRAKYGSGPLVDYFAGAATASADEQIKGAFTRAILVKTNIGVPSATDLLQSAATWTSFAAKRAGTDGNLISVKVIDSTAESPPTTGDFHLCPPQVSTDVAARVSGGAATTATIAAAALPSTTVTTLAAMTGLTCTGGANLALITAVAGTVTVTQDTGRYCHAVISTAWANVPAVGSLAYIPTGSPFTTANEGSYIVTAATSTRLDLYKLLDAAGAGGAITSPSTEGPISIAATSDIRAYSPLVMTADSSGGAQGFGRTLEIYDSGVATFSTTAFEFVSATSSPPAVPAEFVSTSGNGEVLTSVAERKVKLTVERQADGVSENITTGGDVILAVGYTGTTASMVIADNTMTITVTGGSGTSPAAIDLTQYPTVADLAQYLSSLTGFTAAPATAAKGSVAATSLDAGTYTFATANGVRTGRIKADGYTFTNAVNNGSSLGEIDTDDALAGLPDVTALTFLTGGSKGGTTDTNVSDALAACRKVRGNFICTAFSADASTDFAAGRTDANSTYTIEAINANVKSHCLAMSTVKARKPRLGFCAISGTFDEAKEASGNLASARITLGFQPVRALSASGTLSTFPSWMQAAKAAGMQAAGFYKPVFNKLVNITGVLPVEGFDPEEDSEIEDALEHGLLISRKNEDGGYSFVSDQNTYQRDNNPIYNSFQAMYGVDVIVSTCNQRMEKAIVGQSVADMSATAALTIWETVLGDFLGLKLTAPSDGAAAGFKDAKAKKIGASMFLTADIFEATALYFVPITIGVNVTQQSAG